MTSTTYTRFTDPAEVQAELTKAIQRGPQPTTRPSSPFSLPF